MGQDLRNCFRDLLSEILSEILALLLANTKIERYSAPFIREIHILFGIIFSGILFANLRSLGVDVRHGSSSVPLVDR